MSKYPFSEIEAKWQKYWENNKTFSVSEDPSFPKEKRAYVLDMFPYPSGSGLHVGHPEGYTATDIYCRYLRMNSYNVLHPMGFDSFGLPAETYAMQTGTHPKATTEANIANFRRQIKQLGFSYDWDREVSTHEADYYKWTQWIFLKLYERGLAYKAEIAVWYCPALGSVLANEEVITTEHGPRSERGNHPVERRPLNQWMLRITEYAERLLEDLEGLDWPENVIAMQRNWIGKSEGANVTFTVEDCDEQLEIFTTRPDTLFGATYMVLAPEHPLVKVITTPGQSSAVNDYLAKTALKSDLERTDLAKDKTGVFTGGFAVNPVNGKRIPIWISDYILISYGTGAIMAVPAHDQRDYEFATTFGLDIVPVVAEKADGSLPDISEQAFTDLGYAVNSEQFNGQATDEAKKNITLWLEEQGIGKKTTNYKLRDWIFSRQRYWGEPIPLVHAEDGAIEPLSEERLPLELPEVESYKPTGTGESPLAAVDSWVKTLDSKGRPALRETNTMPQWAGSCWYYLRYLDPKNQEEFARKEAIDYWMPVDLYVGGTEHAVLHLLYARFWHKVLFDAGLVNTKEPFQRLVNQGMITSFAFQKKDGSLVPSDQVEEVSTDSFVDKATGEKLERVIAKMSKSLKNVINPDDIINEYGADSMRLYEMFMGPIRQSKPWQTEGLVGIHRFLDRVWRLCEKPASEDEAPLDLKKVLHKTIKKVTEDTAELNFNTAISAMMIFTNEAFKQDHIYPQLMRDFVLLLAPYAPHLGEELWQRFGSGETCAYVSWPQFDPKLVVDDEITLVVQVNGKVRSKLTVAAGLTKEDMEAAALADEKIQGHLEGKTPRKVIVVPGRLVNVVV